jgi:protein-S-isoprenylcysteine O-methyltransferase Ste14
LGVHLIAFAGLDLEIEVANNTRHAIGLAMSIFGVALLVLGAVDYIVKWNQISSGITGIGIMLAVIGAGLVRSTKGDQKK